MSDPNARGFTVALTAEIGEDGRQWIEVMPTADKARNGRWYFTITRDDLEAYATYIQANPDRIPVDYDHEGADGGSTVAAGWFTGQAEVRDTDDGPRLYAEVEWTPQGADDVKQKRFRFISPEWSMQEKDAKTGLLTKAKALVAATLTNRPFFKDLAAVAAVLWEAGRSFEQLRQEVQAALNPGPSDQARYWVMDILLDASSALVQEYAASTTWVVPFTIGANGTDGEVVAAPASEWTKAEQQWVSAAAEALKAIRATRPFTEGEDMPDFTVLAKSRGLPDDADETAIAAAIAARDTENADLKAKVAELEKTASETETLRAEVETIKTERTNDRKEALVAQAVRDRQAQPVQKDWLMTQTVEQLEAYIAATPKATFKETGSGGEGDEGDDPKPDDKVRARFQQGGDVRPIVADEESLGLHLKAEKFLAEQGKPRGVYSEADYLVALDAVA